MPGGKTIWRKGCVASYGLSWPRLLQVGAWPKRLGAKCFGCVIALFFPIPRDPCPAMSVPVPVDMETDDISSLLMQKHLVPNNRGPQHAGSSQNDKEKKKEQDVANFSSLLPALEKKKIFDFKVSPAVSKYINTGEALCLYHIVLTALTALTVFFSLFSLLFSFTSICKKTCNVRQSPLSMSLTTQPSTDRSPMCSQRSDCFVVSHNHNLNTFRCTHTGN